MDLFGDPSLLLPGVESRSASFENPTAAKGAGGTAAGGRKGAPWRRIEPGETVTLLDVEGPGTIRRWWMTIPPAEPPHMRAVWLEVFYDGLPEPSVPWLDFFGVAQGRPTEYSSALTSVQEARGFNNVMPMPFARHVRVEVTNGSAEAIPQLYYQIDLTLEGRIAPDRGLLHVTFDRRNPTTMGDDMVLAEKLSGPGRFLGCVVGIRTIDEGFWYGEGEVKAYLDGDDALPTICGTGLEDYVGTAWGMGAHHAPYAGSPLLVPGGPGPMPAHVGFYRWHVPDPVVFQRDLRVTLQQIGMSLFVAGQDEQFEAFAATHPACGGGWYRDIPGLVAMGIHERVDDVSAAGFVYCREPQPVPERDIAAAVADLERLSGDRVDPHEPMFQMLR
jgi:hypothetical protein